MSRLGSRKSSAERLRVISSIELDKTGTGTTGSNAATLLPNGTRSISRNLASESLVLPLRL